jgi:acyl-CoA thioesterase
VTTNELTPYARDTAVRPDGPGNWRAELTDRWQTGNKTPNGGYLLATTLRALVADMPLPHPLVASATFLRPATAGAAHVSTEVLRSGRRLATGSATLRQDGKPVVHVVSTFRDLAAASGRSWEAAPAPALRAPEDCPSVLGVLPHEFSIITACSTGSSAHRAGWPAARMVIRRPPSGSGGGRRAARSRAPRR